MKAKLTIKMDNASFDGAPGLELASILRDIASRLELSGVGLGDVEGIRNLYDSSGNNVGELEVK